jgi:hypothetical protein
MKTKLFTVLLTLCISFGNAQSSEGSSLIKKEDKLSYKHFVIPAALISSGLLLIRTNENEKLQNDFRKVLGTDFTTQADNYIQYASVLGIYGGTYLGLKAKNDWQHQTVNILIANAAMGIVVKTMKHTFKEERPDSSNHYSFPSGHTASAFTNAALLFYEYKDDNLWYASSGFVFAAATGFLRIANNKHYTSDVLAGAGIGLGVGLAVSYLQPFKSMTFGKNKSQVLVYPQIGNSIGVGVLVLR